jgi:hypothetical protein
VRKTASIQYGVATQTLEYRVPQGRPTSATFKVLSDYAGDDDEVEFEGTATVESVNTVVDATCGASSANPNKVSLTATTGITVNRKYLLSEGSKQEWVQPVEIVSADYIIARYPLKNDYTTAATFVGTHITAAVDDTWVALEENLSNHLDPNPDYRVRWEILVSSATHIAYSYFDLERSPVVHQVDIDDINARCPGLYDSIPTEYRVDQGRPLIESAWRAVRLHLASLNIDVEAIREDEVLDQLVILSARVVLATGGWRPKGYDSLAQYIDETRKDYDRFFEQHFAVTLKHKLAVGTSGGAEIVRPIIIGK